MTVSLRRIAVVAEIQRELNGICDDPSGRIQHRCQRLFVGDGDRDRCPPKTTRYPQRFEVRPLEQL